MSNILRNAVVALVVLAAVSVLIRNLTGAAEVATSTAPLRHYYLTNATLNGNQALTACVTGYHFASFGELSDPAVITYNKTLGRSNADDGSGPPAIALGWIRTGYSASTSSMNPNVPNNCNVWTSGLGTDFGDVLFFDEQFGPNVAATPPAAYVNNKKCDNSDGNSIGVWCVQN